MAPPDSKRDFEGTYWDAPSFLDISLDIIRAVPSKKVNENIIPRKELQFYRQTFEEGNVCVSPLEIVRAFGALALISEGATLDELCRCLRRCLFGSGGNGKESAEQIHRFLHRLSSEYVVGLTPAAVRIFYEKRSVIPFDLEIMKTLNAFYLEPAIPEAPELKEGENVMKEANFRISANGDETRMRLNKAMKIASNGRVEHVIRRDLAPGWRARLILASCMDGNFHWKTKKAEKPRKTYFFDSPDHLIEKRSVVKAVKADCSVRTIIWKSRMRIVELESHDPAVKLYVIQPLYTDLSRIELPTMDGNALREYIDVCSRQPPKQATVMIPAMSMACPINLKPAFHKKKTGSFFSRLFRKANKVKTSIPTMERVFCPYKAEFNRAIDMDKGYGSAFVFPLYDHYHKTKFNILLCERRPININEIRDLIHPPSFKPVAAAALENIEFLTVPGRVNLADLANAKVMIGACNHYNKKEGNEGNDGLEPTQLEGTPEPPPESPLQGGTARESFKEGGTARNSVRPTEKRRQAAEAIERELEFTPIKKKAGARVEPQPGQPAPLLMPEEGGNQGGEEGGEEEGEGCTGREPPVSKYSKKESKRKMHKLASKQSIKKKPPASDKGVTILDTKMMEAGLEEARNARDAGTAPEDDDAPEADKSDGIFEDLQPTQSLTSPAAGMRTRTTKTQAATRSRNTVAPATQQTAASTHRTMPMTMRTASSTNRTAPPTLTSTQNATTRTKSRSGLQTTQLPTRSRTTSRSRTKRSDEGREQGGADAPEVAVPPAEVINSHRYDMYTIGEGKMSLLNIGDQKLLIGVFDGSEETQVLSIHPVEEELNPLYRSAESSSRRSHSSGRQFNMRNVSHGRVSTNLYTKPMVETILPVPSALPTIPQLGGAIPTRQGSRNGGSNEREVMRKPLTLTTQVMKAISNQNKDDGTVLITPQTEGHTAETQPQYIDTNSTLITLDPQTQATTDQQKTTQATSAQPESSQASETDVAGTTQQGTTFTQGTTDVGASTQFMTEPTFSATKTLTRTQLTSKKKRATAGADLNNNSNNITMPHHTMALDFNKPLDNEELPLQDIPEEDEPEAPVQGKTPVTSSRASGRSERKVKGPTYVKYQAFHKGRRASSNRLSREDRSRTLKFEPDEAFTDDSHLSTVADGPEGLYAPMDGEINVDSSFLFVGVATNAQNHRFPLYVGRFTNVNETFAGCHECPGDPLETGPDYPLV